MTDSSLPERYPFRASEQKWQQAWETAGIHTCNPETAGDKPPYYMLEMFPYPSGNIHMGHVRNYTLGDALARFKRAQGFDVLHPMGWDAFGLPAENAAIERNVHPGAWTHQNIATMRDQLKMIGLSYDWDREFATCDAEYYKHEQRFFLAMVKHGLAYRKEAEVNWDPVDHTVLANEQVIDGRGWRSGELVERKKLSQWFLRITDFAEDLLQGLDTLKDWPEKVRTMQENWIGKSSGAKIRFAIEGRDESLEVYTTRPDTLFGMSFAAIALNHPIAEALIAEGNSDLEAFITECNASGTTEAAIDKAEKKGFDTGLRIPHPFTGELKPLYVANFVLMDYGTGAVFGCPAHDQRDLDFARQYGLPVTPVVAPKNLSPEEQSAFTVGDEAYSDGGVLIHSDFLNGMGVDEAKEQMIVTLEEKNFGERCVNYRLRDWGISRQRYWGCPIPMIHCSECGIVPVPESDLPVTLPEEVNFDIAGNPLDRNEAWQKVDCPQCGAAAKRETDTFDTFFESSWYFLRFLDPQSDQPVNKALASRYMPVDRYVGGVEHAVLHLLYARFFTKALQKMDYIDVNEPFNGLMTQGMVCHETYKGAEGNWLYPDEVVHDESGTVISIDTHKPIEIGRSIKMSKSKRNTVDPRHIIESYGADTARLFILSDSPPDRDLEWTQSGIDGAWRYVNRLWRIVTEPIDKLNAVNTADYVLDTDNASALIKSLHKTIHQVSNDFEHLHYNKAIAGIREFTNMLGQAPLVSDAECLEYKVACEAILQLIAPMMPHLAEECWAQLGHQGMICEAPWPVADEALLVENTITVAVQVNGKLRGTLELVRDGDKKCAEEAALAHENVVSHIEGKTIRKVIVVPNKIVNIVAA